MENCFLEIQFCVLGVFGGLGMFHVFPRWHTQLGFYTGRAVAPPVPAAWKTLPRLCGGGGGGGLWNIQPSVAPNIH